MTGDEELIDGVRTLLDESAGLPVRGFGVVRQDGPAHVVLTCVDPLGITAWNTLKGSQPRLYPNWA